MDRSATQLLKRDILMRHGLDDIRAGHEHVARLLHHDDKVRNRGTVDRTAGTGSHDHADLRHHARSDHIAVEDVGISRQAHDALLDARTARVVQANNRRTVVHGHVHDLADLRGMRTAHTAAKYCEVLGVDIDQSPVDRAVSGDDAVTGNLLIRQPKVYHSCA